MYYIYGEEKFRSLYNGWLNTGDVGFLDENNELHIVERIDNLINIDSHKIYPSDIDVVTDNMVFVVIVILSLSNYTTIEFISFSKLHCSHMHRLMSVYTNMSNYNSPTMVQSTKNNDIYAKANYYLYLTDQKTR